MKGLHDLITHKRAQLTRCRALALDPEATPQRHHDATVNVAELERSLEPLCRDADLGEAMAARLAAMIDDLRSCVSGDDLRLAITHLEDARFRLRRHLGSNPH